MISMIKRLISVLIIGFLTGISFTSFCQGTELGVSVGTEYGFLLPHRSKMQHLVKGHTSNVQIGAVFQTDETKPWAEAFHYPKINVDFIFADLGNPEVLGRVFGLRSSIYLPYFKKKGWSFGSKIGTGIGYVTKRYDKKFNPKDIAIGSHINFLATIGFELEKKFKRNAFSLEMNMSHLSNGAYKLPNLGVNLVFLGVSYTHYLKKLETKQTFTKNMNPQPLHSWQFFIQAIASTKQIYPTGGNNYGILGVTNFTQFKAGKKCKIEGGIDLNYNQSIVVEEYGDHKSANFQMGIYSAYVLSISRLQILIGMGRYLINPLNPRGMWYHKFGGRIRITEKLWGNITIKSHWAKADYFEYGLTYRW